MKGCHFQDVPRRKSVCLRVLCQQRERQPHYRTCDEHREERCQYRAWDVDVRLEVVRQRSLLTDSCPGCNGRHENLAEQYGCVCRCRMEEAFRSSPAYLEAGSVDDLFEAAPLMIRANMWRKLRNAVVERDRGVCQDCGRELTHLPKWYTEVHHIIPRIRGGGDHPANLKTLCIECHRKYTDEMLLSRIERTDEAYQAAILFKK
ncbi:MAG TPA: HNH endonuclease [Methanomassiliicoccales archaeon]